MVGLTRKELLAGAAAAGVVAGCGVPAKPAAFDPGDWASVKAQFALDPGVRHFDAFVLASHPRPVRDAVERHRQRRPRRPRRRCRAGRARRRT